MEASVITLLFLLFAVVMFVWEKIPLGVTSMVVCIGLVVTGVLDWKTAEASRKTLRRRRPRILQRTPFRLRLRKKK